MDLLHQNLWGICNHAFIFPKAPQMKKTENQQSQGERHEEEPSFKLNYGPGINQPTTATESTCWTLFVTQTLACFYWPHSTSLPRPIFQFSPLNIPATY